MTRTSPASSDRSSLLSGFGWALFVVFASGTLAAVLLHPGLLRPTVFVALVPAVVALGVRAPSTLLYGLAIWLVALGLVRRLFDTTAPVSHAGLGDPLLLVEPVIVIILTAIAIQRGALRRRTRLANAVLVLSILAVVEVVNPLQGSPLVGVGGWLFLLVPILAFWVGRSLVDDLVLRRLFILIALLAVGAVMYGLFQQKRGLPSWDQAWVAASNYTSLNVGKAIRAFGTFSAASEYATFLAIGTVICAAALTRRRAIPLLAVGGLLCYGVFYDSSRGILILTAAALGVMWAASQRLRPIPALSAGIIGVSVLLAAAGHFSTQTSTPTTEQASLVQHQLQGLSNPLNSKDSTLSLHFSEMVKGLKSSITQPLGHGTGAVNLAASRLGGTSTATEVDPSNMGVALGLPGLVAYFIVVTVGLVTAYRVAAANRTWWAFAGLGVLVVTFLQWSNGGQYAVAWLPWLVMGWADRAAIEQFTIRSASDNLGAFAPTGLL